MLFTAIGLGIAAAGALAGALGSAKASRASANATIANSQAAVANFSQQANSNNNRYAEEVEAARQKQQQVYLQNLQAKATAQTSAAGSGISGISIENLFKGYDRADALSNFISERNLRNLGMQYDDNYEALRTGAVNAVYSNQAYTGQTAGSSLLSSLGGIIQTASTMKWS